VLSIEKLGIGFLPVRRMFRVDNLWGALVDLAGRQAAETLELGYPTVRGFAPVTQETPFWIKFPSTGFEISVTTSTIAISQSTYKLEKKVNLERFLEDFSAKWRMVNSVLEPETIRRIGVYAEHRVANVALPSGTILDKLTRLDSTGFPHKANLTFQRKSSLSNGAEPDEKRDAYINVIASIYDSALDRDESAPNAINANLDVQRHFTPPLATGGAIEDAARALVRKQFTEEWKTFASQMTAMGLPL
jgi:hypothetical protein